MKKLISAILIVPFFLFMTQASFAQQQDVVKSPLSVEDYLKKSKRQKTTGWILTSAGVGLTLVSLAQATASGFNYTSDDDETGGSVTSAIALASLATGTYFFIASGKNKRKARNASVFIDMEQIPLLHQAAIRKTNYPSVGLSLKF